MAGGEHVYATLLLSDSYLPGALVLAHSLRDARTTVKLAVLVTLDTVSAHSINELNKIYDYVLPVPLIRNASPANLYLMNRGDLHSAFTKINLWRLVQFSKIVYIDADVVAYRAPDELFSIPHAFAAAPDIGWPDLFNTGVMVLTPDLGEYYAMMAMAERGISFDGADQGLLNMHFKNNYHRLSFTYNVTPSAHYQYIPAYRHFQSSINMVHFIGANKPWFAGRHAPHSNSPFDEMVGRWWAVHDRHYRAKDTAPSQHTDPPSVQHHNSAFPQEPFAQHVATGEHVHRDNQSSHGMEDYGANEQHHHNPSSLQHEGGNGDGGAHRQEQHHPEQHHPEQHHQEHHHQGHHHQEQQQQHHQGEENPGDNTATHDFAQHASRDSASNVSEHTEVQPENPTHHSHDARGPPPEEHKHEPESHSIEMSNWDAQWQPPPADSKPEAMNFPSTQYSMSQDAALFVPPERYPSPPKNMWYEVPSEPPAPSAQPPKPVFPWEGHQPRASRSFAPDSFLPGQISTAHGEHKIGDGGGSQADAEESIAGSATADTGSDPQAPSTPTVTVSPPPVTDIWSSFQQTNAWDEIPEIERYVEGLQQHRRIRSQGSVGTVGSPAGRGTGGRRMQKPSGFKLTDFPSEVERPSLPVTPAPIARPSFWSEGDTETDPQPTQALPAAQGVPAQSDWDPEEQLQKLARLQHEALLRKLGGQSSNEGDETANVKRAIPKRSLPFGSEDVKSPTYVQQAPAMSQGSAPQPPLPSTSSGGRGFPVGQPIGRDSRQTTLLDSPMPDLDA